MPYVFDEPRGRLGNAIFRYLASSLFCILYKAHRIYPYQRCTINISDEYFLKWKEEETLPAIPEAAICRFNDYYQHDSIYLKYLKELKDHIMANPTDILKTDRGDIFLSGQLLHATSAHQYDVVLHLRLEDFIQGNIAIHPESVKKLIETIKPVHLCIVVNKPTTEIEHQYLRYIQKDQSNTLESNDILTDYNIMRNAKTLICSKSTICWAAALLSDTLTHAYIPNYQDRHAFETFRRVGVTTTPYEMRLSTNEELAVFLSSF